MINLDFIKSKINNIRIPISCQKISNSKIKVEVIKSLFSSDIIKIIIDLGNEKYESSTLSIISQKIQGLIKSLPNLNITANLVFVGNNADYNNLNAKSADLSGTFIPIDKIKQVIAICSGKGGVGKSTIAANLAVKLSQKGYKIGIIDTDIYGSSIPTIFGIENIILDTENNKIKPFTQYGIKIISIGLLTSVEMPIIWRGPMLSKALHKMFRQSDWGELDYLIVDTPPGTGDIHISLMQNYPVNQVVLVSNQDRLSELNTNKTKQLFENFGIPIVSKVYNMVNNDTNPSDHIADYVPFGFDIKNANNNGKPFLLDNNNSQILEITADKIISFLQ